MIAKSLLVNIARRLWYLAVLIFLLYTVLISLGRVVLPRITHYQPEIQQYLSDTLKADVSFSHVEGVWQGFQPQLNLQQFSVVYADQSVPSFSAERLEFRFDLYSSLMTRVPVFASVLVDGVELVFHQTAGKKWKLMGREAAQTARPVEIKSILVLLLAQKNLTAKNIVIKLLGNSGQPELLQKQIDLDELLLRCSADACSAKANLVLVDDSQAAISLALNTENTSNLKRLNVDGYLDIDPVKLESWYRFVTGKPLISKKITRAHLGGRFWFQVSQGSLSSIQGSITIPEVESMSGETPVTIGSLNTELLWRGNRPLAVQPEKSMLTGFNDWSLYLQDLTFNQSNGKRLKTNVQVTFTKRDGLIAVDVLADRVDLEIVKETLLAIDLLPEKGVEVLATLDPKGLITHVNAVYNQSGQALNGGKPLFSIEANLDNVGVSPWNSVPGGTGINGYLYATPNEGRIELKTESFSIYFPKYYSNPFKHDQAQGVVRWRNQGKEFWLDSDELTLKDKGDTFTGKFSLAQPKDGTEPRFNLLIGLDRATARSMLNYVPDKLLSTNLVGWLNQAIMGGDVKNARFLYSGPAVKSDSNDDKSIQLDFVTSSAELHYLPGWPHLNNVDAQVNLIDRSATITSRSGSILNLALEDIKVELDPVEEGSLLTVSSRISGSTEDGLRILQDTPLRASLFDLIDDFQGEGDLDATLDLRIPLPQVDELTIDLAINTANSRFNIPSLGVDFHKINGGFHYGTQSGLAAKSVKATFFDEPVNIDIQSRQVASTKKDSDENNRRSKHQVLIDMDGRLDAKHLGRWLPPPLLVKLDGQSEYRASLNLGGGLENRLTIATDLRGIQSKLPKPFNKKSDVVAPLIFSMILADEQQHLIRYGEQLDAALVFNGKMYTEGEVVLGGKVANLTRNKGLSILGSLPFVEVDEWVRFFETFSDTDSKAGKRSNSGSSGLASDDIPLNSFRYGLIAVDEIDFYGQPMLDVSLTLARQKGDWSFDIDSSLAKGHIHYFEDQRKPVSIALDYLRLMPGKDPKANTDALKGVIPQNIADTNFSTGELSIGSDNYGAGAFNLRANDEGVAVEQVSWDIRGLKVLGKLDWLYKDGQHKTVFLGSAKTNNIANVLSSWGYSPTVEGKSGIFEGNLSWPGSPAAFAVPALTGDVHVNAADGRFVEIDGASNALRVFGVLNFNSIARRLRLDFSDLVKKGYSYDTVKGQLNFNAGEIIIKDSLIIDGPSAKFKIDGRTDLINNRFDQNMVVVLPFSGNLPIAAAIVGAPIVGVPLYLINKIFGDQLERFTSAFYTITGPWDAPKVELVSVLVKKDGTDKSSSASESRAGTSDGSIGQ
jgi:uncharacterized protein (TIGR02099 family)